jgi:hypothetical protein
MSAGQAGLAFITNHNQTYVLLKHLPWWRRLVFLAYTFGVGDRGTMGILRLAWMAARHHWPAASCRAHLAGKLAGIRSFQAWRSCG